MRCATLFFVVLFVLRSGEGRWVVLCVCGWRVGEPVFVIVLVDVLVLCLDMFGMVSFGVVSVTLVLMLSTLFLT